MYWFFALLLTFLELNAATIRFDGYIGKEEIQKQESSIPQQGELVIEIKSVSGDLNAVLDLARKLYRLKPGLKIRAVIFDTALGPSAILPFLADEIDTTPFVSWGDITLGSENVLPTNILLNQVISLIPDKPDLRELAQSMLDPNGPSIRDFKLTGQTLVLNRAQMEALGLAKKVVESAIAKPVKEETPSPFSAIKFNKEGKNIIGRIVIDDRDSGISQATWIYVKAALDSYKASKPIFVILELNTPGGEVFAAQTISDALKELDTQYNIP
ncbi:MAG: serine protease, partial [Parachlamydiaceae bacterium]